MEDKQLLELAAKAAGVWSEADPWNGMLKPNGQYWNPLTDDGDALRLAAKLNIDLALSQTCAMGGNIYRDSWSSYEERKGDDMAPVRRAIVVAAASAAC